MSKRFNPTRLLAASFIFLAQCSAPPTRSTLSAFESSLGEWVSDPAFSRGPSILAGFDPPKQEASWEADAWALLGVKVEHDGSSDVWYVRLSSLPPRTDDQGRTEPLKPRRFTVPISAGSVKGGTSYMSSVGRMRIELFDQDGELLRSSIRVMPQSCPTPSLQALCADFQANPDASADGVVTLMSTLLPMGTAKAMVPVQEKIRKNVIREPTILTFLLNGLRLKVDAAFTDSRPISLPWSQGVALAPMYMVEAPVNIAGQHVMNCRMLVGPPGSPYHLTAGVLLFEATHPDKPRNKLTIRLLAAQRVTETDECADTTDAAAPTAH
jgi:hypothetical protein